MFRYLFLKALEMEDRRDSRYEDDVKKAYDRLQRDDMPAMYSLEDRLTVWLDKSALGRFDARCREYQKRRRNDLRELFGGVPADEK